MGKFLKIFFGCHGRADRSFFFRGKQFPICARCTGELVGILCGIPIAIYMGCACLPLSIVMMAPMIIDGFVQLWTSYESNNRRRFITGFLFGIAFIFLLIYFHRICVKIAGIILKLFMEEEKVEKGMRVFLLNNIVHAIIMN